MKAYTDLSQSKKLAEILPLESADMLFQLGEDKYADSIRVSLTKKHWEQMMPAITPCWSLAALLEVLHDYTLQTTTYGKVFVVYEGKQSTIISSAYHKPVDACVDMISLLNERNLI